MRQRKKGKQSPDKAIDQRYFEPGDLVYELGRRNGWPIATRNIMLEGTLDVAYYELADNLYRREHGRTLLDSQLSLFAVGEREDGGTFNIPTKFVTLRDVLSKDPVDRNGERILAICLVDNDWAGRKLNNTLRGSGFVLYKDVFLLQRRLPCSTRAPHEFEIIVERENSRWKHLDCVIEDLLDRDLLELFAKQQSQALRSEPVIVGEAHHYDFEMHAKSALLRYVRDNAMLPDMENLVNVLKAMRFALGLDTDGTSIE